MAKNEKAVEEMNAQKQFIVERVVNQINPAIYREKIYNMIMSDEKLVEEIEVSENVRRTIEKWGEEKEIF